MSTVGFYTDAGEQTNVSASVAAAEAAATASATSASNAATSETNTEALANSVLSSEAAAAASASAALNSENNASTEADNSANSAIASAASSVAASVSEGNALTSETNAAASENNAASVLADALMKNNNLSDIASASSSRTNLGLGSASVTNVGTGPTNVPTTSQADARYFPYTTTSALKSALNAEPTNWVKKWGPGIGTTVNHAWGDGWYLIEVEDTFGVLLEVRTGTFTTSTIVCSTANGGELKYVSSNSAGGQFNSLRFLLSGSFWNNPAMTNIWKAE